MRGRDFSRYFKRFLNLTARRVVLVDEDKESRVIGRLNDLFRNLLAPVGQIVNGDLANPFWRFFGRRRVFFHGVCENGRVAGPGGWRSGEAGLAAGLANRAAVLGYWRPGWDGG